MPTRRQPGAELGHVHNGRLLLRTFREAFMLKQIHRSKDDLWWTQSCLRLRDFQMNLDDYFAWIKHDLRRGHLTQEQKDYFNQKAVWLCSRCEDVGQQNGRKLASRAQDKELLVHKIVALHPGSKGSASKAAKLGSSAFDGLRPVVHLVRGC